MIEDFVRKLFPDINFFNGQLDAEYHGVPVEVKSCQNLVTDNSHNTHRRTGRIAFESAQHRALSEAGGEYFCVVHEEGVPKTFFRAPTDKLQLHEFSGIRSVAWTTVARWVI